MISIYYLSSNYFQAVGSALTATVVSVLRQGALLIPCLYIFHAFLGLPGIGIAHLASDVAAVGIAVVLFVLHFRKQHDAAF